MLQPAKLLFHFQIHCITNGPNKSTNSCDEISGHSSTDHPIKMKCVHTGTFQMNLFFGRKNAVPVKWPKGNHLIMLSKYPVWIIKGCFAVAAAVRMNSKSLRWQNYSKHRMFPIDFNGCGWNRHCPNQFGWFEIENVCRTFFSINWVCVLRELVNDDD